MNKKTSIIFFLCGCSIGYTIVLGRFIQIEYIKLSIIFCVYFLSGYFIRNYCSFISVHTLLFLFPGLFLIFFAVFANSEAIFSWLTELLVVFISFPAGYITSRFTGAKRLYVIFGSMIFISVLAFIINPRILLLTQFKSYQKNENININTVVNFDIVKINGEKITSNDVKEKTVLLDFWFIGCAPCYEKMKYLGEIAEHYKNRKDIVIIAIDTEDGNKYDNFKKVCERFPQNLIYAYDSASLFARKLNLKGFPTELIIDKTGKIQHRFVGFNKDIALIYSSKTIQKIDDIANAN